MTIRRSLGILAAAALVGAGTAQAAPVPVSMTLTVSIQNIGAITISGPATVDITAGVITVPAALSLASTVNLPVTTTTAVVSVIGKAGLDQFAAVFGPGSVTANTPAEICPAGVTPRACIGGGGTNGPMALSGTVSVNLGGGVTIGIPLAAALVGVGGTTTQPPVTGFFFENGVWTNGTAAVQFTTSTTTTTFVVGQTFSMMNSGIAQTVTAMGSGSAAALSAGGQVTLVTPTFVLALGNKLPVFATLTLIPEPGTLLLLGAGIAGLAILGVRRRK